LKNNIEPKFQNLLYFDEIESAVILKVLENLEKDIVKELKK
jgi:hypothetical protein